MGPRRSVRLAAVATAALVAGLLPGTDSVASGGTGSVVLAYACAFSAGSQDVTAEFTQEFPPRAATGIPLRPGELTLAVTIPRAGVSALLPASAASVTAGADLTTHITEGASSADAHWPGLRAPATAVPGDGALTLTLTGAVPGVDVTMPGHVAFAAGVFTLTLHPDSTPPAGTPTPGTPEPGTPTPTTSPPESTAPAAPDPATPAAGTSAPTTSAAPSTPAPGDVTGTCAPTPGQDTTLGTVTVPGVPAAPGERGGPAAGGGPLTAPGGEGAASGGGSAAPGGTPSTAKPAGPSAIVPLDAPAHSGVSTCGPTPHGTLDPARLPKDNPGAIVLPFPGMPPFPDSPQCAFVVGFSNVNKLNGAMIVNDPHGTPALANINSGRRKVLDFIHQYVEVDSLASLVLPPSHSTFLTYGFMPTTAEVDFVPRGPMTIVQSGDDFFNQPILTEIGGYQDIRIHDVRVNGTPLDVGPNCRTAYPVDIVLSGRKDAGLPGDDGRPDYDIADGGPLTDLHLVIPPFTGCATDGGHGENLDALFTAAISGPGNTLNLVQGRLCDPINLPESCLPEIQIPPLPRRK